MRKSFFAFAIAGLTFISCDEKNNKNPKVTFPEYSISEKDFRENLAETDSISAKYSFKSSRSMLNTQIHNYIVLTAYPKSVEVLKPENSNAMAISVLKYAKQKIKNLREYDKMEIVLSKDGKDVSFDKNKSEYFTEK